MSTCAVRGIVTLIHLNDMFCTDYGLKPAVVVSLVDLPSVRGAGKQKRMDIRQPQR